MGVTAAGARCRLRPRSYVLACQYRTAVYAGVPPPPAAPQPAPGLGAVHQAGRQATAAKGGQQRTRRTPPWERNNDNDEAAPNGPPTYGPTDWAATQLRFVHDALSQPGPCGRLGGLVGSRGGGRSPTLFLNEGCEAPRTHDKPRLQRRASRAEQGVAAPLDFSLCVQDGSRSTTSAPNYVDADEGGSPPVAG